MKNIQVSEEELEMMNYNDIAFLILEKNGKKMKINALFTEVGKLLKLDEDTYQSHIGDFFELLSTDKRFIMLEDGNWDLRVKHNKGMEDFDDEDEEDDIIIEEEEDTETGFDEDEDKNEDDDVDDDDLSDLVIVDDMEDEAN